MNKNQTKYVSSPYIVFESINGNKVTVNNLLSDQRIEIEKELLAVYKHCKEPGSEEEICCLFEKGLFDRAIDREMIIDNETVWNPMAFQCAEIEVGTICNYRCEYCPVHFDPKKPRIMSLEKFQAIINEIANYPGIKDVSLSSFNEPLLDPFFEQRIDILKNHGLSLILHTNGSKLNKSVVDFLNQSGCVKEVHVNFPYYDAEKYRGITGSDEFDTVCSNIDYAIETGIQLDFSIQKTDADYKNNLKVMNQVYADRIGKTITAWTTVDRCGILQNEYSQGIHISGLLSGCKNILKWLMVNVDGNCFICSNDYYNSYKYGNILENRLQDIVASPAYSNLIKCIFGSDDPGENFICRKCYEMKIMHTYRRMEKPIKRLLDE